MLSLPHPILAQLGSFTLYTHGVFFALGALLALGVAATLRRGATGEQHQTVDLVLLIFIAGLLGARVAYCLLYPSQITHWSDIFALWRGGLVSYGGFFAGAGMAVYLLRDQSSAERYRWFDYLAVATLAGWCVGRVGNFLAGDVIGIPSATWSTFGGQVPVPLLEALWSLVLAILGYRACRRATSRPGMIGYLLLGSYGFGRLVIDRWRAEVIQMGPFNLSQVAAFVLVIAALVGVASITGTLRRQSAQR